MAGFSLGKEGPCKFHAFQQQLHLPSQSMRRLKSNVSFERPRGTPVWRAVLVLQGVPLFAVPVSERSRAPCTRKGRMIQKLSKRKICIRTGTMYEGNARSVKQGTPWHRVRTRDPAQARLQAPAGKTERAIKHITKC